MAWCGRYMTGIALYVALLTSRCSSLPWLGQWRCHPAFLVASVVLSSSMPGPLELNR
jgi:hypothetical protein